VWRDFEITPLTRTVSPSARPRSASAVLRTSSWLAPSCYQQTLRPPGREDARCVRPTSATQSNCVHPHLARSRLLTPLSRRGHPTETKAPRGTSGGLDVSRRPKTASADRHCNTVLILYCLTAWSDERGRFLPTALNATEPLTPLSRSTRSSSRLIHLRGCCTLAVRPRLRGLVRVGGCGEAPRPPLSPSRESRRIVMIRDAFHRQGLFVGSGGPYSPGPATASPLLAMGRPLDDDLSTP